MKYKFRLSYKDGNKYIPINLNDTEITTIDEFTTNYESYEEMLKDLKENKLIPKDINELFVTFDVIRDNKVYEQLYAYNKTLFFKNDKNKLKYSYIYRYFKDKIFDGDFLLSVIEHYKRKYTYKNFDTLEGIVRVIKEHGYFSMSVYSRKVFLDELDYFLDFIFKKDSKKGKIINYKNIRDFLCYINGEEPIKVKGNYIYETHINTNASNIEYNCVETENVTLEEYKIFNKGLFKNSQKFDAYNEGNDFIAPMIEEEIEESLNSYAKKYTLKRDNGEYE